VHGSGSTRAPHRRLGDRLFASELPGRAFEAGLALAILLLIFPVLVALALGIKLDSPGPVLFRCRRLGHGGREFEMLKFRKMRVDAVGGRLTSADDLRFTRIGRLLATMKLDELPQLWNVIRGDMSFVGPRPEDPYFVRLYEDAYRQILRVRPGVTGLSQLAFASESRLLAGPDNVRYYAERLLPQKVAMDQLYASRKSPLLDARIIAWTLLAVGASWSVAVNRETAKLTLRRRRVDESALWQQQEALLPDSAAGEVAS
jgi:lipopolysaccharide/colanic/teichoic acid biosynthesis glycosyltransferase